MRLLAAAAACLMLAGLAPAQKPDVTIRSTAQEVVLDLLVRDGRGRQVKGLAADELEVYEDGVRQQIRSFRLVSGKETLAAQPAAAENPGAAPVPERKKAGATPLAAVNLVSIVFHNLDANNRQFAVEAAQEFLRTPLPANTWIGVFNLAPGLVPVQAFTTDREAVIRAATKAFTTTTVDFMSMANAVLTTAPAMITVETTTTGDPASGGSVSSQITVTGGEINQTAIAGADAATGTSANIMRGEQASQRRVFGTIEGMRQTDQMIAMIDQLGRLPGRKTVLLFSPGLATTGDANRFDSILERAHRANMTIYSIDVNGLTQNSNVIAGNAALAHAAAVSRTQARVRDSAANNMEKMRQDEYVQNAVRTSDTQASLRALSEGTGGALIGSTNDLRKPFLKVLEDLGTHYEVSYRPQGEKLDGRFRNIRVKPARPNLVVQCRSGYFALPDATSLEPYELKALAALSAEPRAHAFDFGSRVLQFRTGPENSNHAAAFELPAGNLAATAEPEARRHRVHVSMLSLVKDSTGQVVQKLSKDSPFEVPDANLEALRTTPIMFTEPMDLPPGHYTLETAIIDRESNRTSTGTIAFDSPEHKGVGLSSIMLVQRYEPAGDAADGNDPFLVATKPQSRHVVPELSASLGADAKPAVYFVVYPDQTKAEKPRIRIELLSGNHLVADQTADLPAPDARGAIPMIVRPAAHPGKCDLRITAMQGGESVSQSVSYTIGNGGAGAH